jgi:predicted glycoside hydrolase/deacetylase ChbG (UPF0249 family)
LIVNADDFGFSPGVTAGILEAHAAGSVTSTSMLVRCAGWDDGVRNALATPTLGIGLHFNLLVGTPLVAAASVTGRDGRFVPLRTLVLRALRRAIDADEVAAECEAQLAALAASGIRVTHIDSHRHVHALPVVRGAVASVAMRHGLPLRRPVESAAWFPFDASAQLHKAVVAAAWVATGTSVAPRTTDHFVGISLQGGSALGRRLPTVLDRIARGTTELMVHPGRVDAALESADRYTWQRQLELATLVSPVVRDRLRRGDLTLIGFGAL